MLNRMGVFKHSRDAARLPSPLVSPQFHLTPLKEKKTTNPHLLAILLPMQSTFLRSQRIPYITVCAPGPPHKERQKRMLTSFIDKDCQESRLQTKGLNLVKGERMRRLCQRWQALLSFFSSSDYIFLAWSGGKDGAMPSAQLICFSLKSLLPSSPHEQLHNWSSGLWGCCLSLQSIAIESPLNPS